MAGVEGYTGPDIFENKGVENTPIGNDKKNNIKDALGNLKQNINRDNIQLNNIIEETFDSFNEQSKIKLSEQQRIDIKKQLLESSKNNPSQKLFLDKVLYYIKFYGEEVELSDFDKINQKVLNEQTKKNTVEAKENTVEAKESTVEAKERKNVNLKILNNSLGGLNSKSGNFEEYKDVLNKIEILTKEDGYSEELFKEIMKDLENPAKLKFIVEDLQKQDEENGTHNLINFRNSLIKIDGKFEGILDKLEDTTTRAKIVLGKENIYGVDIGKNILRIRDNDGSITEAGKEGRKLFLEGSDYKLDSKINNGGALRDISGIEKDFKEEMEAINKELDTLVAIMEYVDDAITNNVELSVVKQTIKSQNVNLYNKMNLDSLTSLEQVKNSFVLMIKQKEEEKEKKIKEKKGIIDEIVRQNALNAKEIDEKKKEILKFLHQIKFDLLPKDLTDQIINEFKSNVFGIPGLDLNKDTIDLTNGKFGEGVNESGGDRWKDNLVKFMEKMIYGQIGTKESIFSGKQFKGELGANIDPLVINTALEQNGLKTELGWNINTIRNNLKKENTSK